MVQQITRITFFISILFGACSEKSKYIFNEGFDHGTTYHITYESPNGADLHEGIIKTMKMVDSSLSTFNSYSTISKVNQNRATVLDNCFLTVYKKAMEVSETTNGAFDITVAPLYWKIGISKPDENNTINQERFIIFQQVSKDYVCISDFHVFLLQQCPMPVFPNQFFLCSYSLTVCLLHSQTMIFFPEFSLLS